MDPGVGNSEHEGSWSRTQSPEPLALLRILGFFEGSSAWCFVGNGK